MSIDWTEELAGQLDSHWRSQLRPRLDGLTDEEYFWEPVPGMWSVRRRGESRASGESTVAIALGGGEFTQDFAWPAPDPVPATTIAWRLSHLIVGVFGMRVAAHFGGEPVDYQKYDYPGDAATALARLDEVYAAWIAGVRGLGADGLARPCGPAEGPYAEASMATLVLHINREALHHGAEVALLRDLFRWQPGEA
jgi:DinB family protein